MDGPKLGGTRCHPGSKFHFFFSAQTTLLLAMVWIMRSSTVTCLMLEFSSPRCTKRIQAIRPEEAVLAPRARDQSYKWCKDLSYKWYSDLVFLNNFVKGKCRKTASLPFSSVQENCSFPSFSSITARCAIVCHQTATLKGKMWLHVTCKHVTFSVYKLNSLSRSELCPWSYIWEIPLWLSYSIELGLPTLKIFFWITGLVTSDWEGNYQSNWWLGGILPVKLKVSVEVTIDLFKSWPSSPTHITNLFRRMCVGHGQDPKWTFPEQLKLKCIPELLRNSLKLKFI